MKPLGLKRMPFATARSDGKGIAFRFLTHSGKTFDFDCPPAAVPEIVARLLGAVEEAAQKANPSPDYVSDLAEVESWKVGTTRRGHKVGLILYPAPHTGIGFALTPSDAEAISSQLAHAASKIEPKDPRRLS